MQKREENVSTTSLTAGGHEIPAEPARQFPAVISHEQSKQRPRALRPEEAGEKNYFGGGVRGHSSSESFDPSRYDDPRPDAPKWMENSTASSNGG
jgi:hypothetical protein